MTGNGAQYCPLVISFCDATVSSRYLFPEIKTFSQENKIFFFEIDRMAHAFL
jgi:hypothetical protein